MAARSYRRERGRGEDRDPRTQPAAPARNSRMYIYFEESIPPRRSQLDVCARTSLMRLPILNSMLYCFPYTPGICVLLLLLLLLQQWLFIQITKAVRCLLVAGFLQIRRIRGFLVNRAGCVSC